MAASKGNEAAERGAALAAEPRRLLTGAEAVERLESRILGRAPSRDCAAAEGLALAGVRAASSSDEAAGELLGAGRVRLQVSCVHHLRSEPGAVAAGAFELAAASAEDALQQCVAAHLLSAWLGRAGVCSMAPALAEGLSLVTLPSPDEVARLLRAEPPEPREGVASPAGGAAAEEVAPAREIELAAAALNLAAGRSRSAGGALVDVAGNLAGERAAAELVLVAAGPQSAVARETVRRLEQAGLSAVALCLGVVRPFPTLALREALSEAFRGAKDDVRHVFVLQPRSAPGALLESVRDALPEDARVLPLEVGSAAAALESLAAALPENARVVGEARDAAGAAEARPTHRLVVAPSGAWGRDMASRVLAGLAERRPLRVEGRSRSHLGATVLAWSESGSQGGNETRGEVSEEGRDLLLAAGPALLEPRGALALLRPGSAVVFPAASRSSRELAGLVSAEARTLLVERNLDIYWVDPSGDGDGDGDGECKGEGQDQDLAGSERLVAAAVAVIARAEASKREGGDDPDLGRGAGDIQRLRLEELAAGVLLEEVDFRAPSPLPRMPRLVDAQAARERWGEWIHRFHSRGASEPVPAPELPLRPLALEQLAGRLRESASHPFALVPGSEEGPPLLARGLAELLGEAMELMAEAGHKPQVLTRNLDALISLVAHRLAESEEPGELREVVASAGAELGELLGFAQADAQADSQADGESDAEPDAQRFAAELAALQEHLSAGAPVLGLRADTPLRLYVALQSAAKAPLRRRFGLRLERLRERLRDLLELDHLSSDSGRATDAVAASLGDAGARYLDPSALSKTLPEPASKAHLDAERRRRVEDSLARIEEYLDVEDALQEVVFLHTPGHRLYIRDLQRRVHPDPLAAAIGYFDGVARRMAGLFRAVRVAELEAEGIYRAELHEGVLADLGWEAFTSEELALVPRVAVVTTGRRLRGRGQGSLSELLRSSRPVHVIVQDDPAAADEARDFSSYHLDLGSLVMAHREVLALSSTLARPDYLCERLARMARAPRPAVALLQLPPPQLARLRPLLAEAALEGRACADFLYDPDAGASWADRLDIAGSPQPERAWPLHRVELLDAEGGEASLELAITFADAVALDPAYAAHLRVIPVQAWDDERQLPLADYLERFDPEGVPRSVPFIWCLDEDGFLQRCVVTRELALASRDRLRAWRVLQELAGFENAYAELAAEAARESVLADAAREREMLEQLHAEALASAREAGARESMERLALVLTSPGGVEAAAGLTGEALTAAADRPAAPGRPPLVEADPEGAQQQDPDERALDEQSLDQDDEDEDLAFDDPYIDSPLCTTCNECTNLNSRLFHYNDDKQAFIADAGAGSFAELVTAAEKCPAKCIHPGKPRPDDASATPQMLERAAKFA